MNIDIDSLARDILSTFQTDHSDYGHGDVSGASDDLVKLIRAVVRTEVQAAFLEDPETAVEKTKTAADLFHEEEYERVRCTHVGPGGYRCRLKKWHVDTASNTDHRYL